MKRTLISTSTDPKRFWSTMRRLLSSRLTVNNINPNDWFSYFRGLFLNNTPRDDEFPLSEDMLEMLNSDFLDFEIDHDILNGRSMTMKFSRYRQTQRR